MGPISPIIVVYIVSGCLHGRNNEVEANIIELPRDS